MYLQGRKSEGYTSWNCTVYLYTVGSRYTVHEYKCLEGTAAFLMRFSGELHMYMLCYYLLIRLVICCEISTSKPNSKYGQGRTKVFAAIDFLRYHPPPHPPPVKNVYKKSSIPLICRAIPIWKNNANFCFSISYLEFFFEILKFFFFFWQKWP